jgi:hypothetical protein
MADASGAAAPAKGAAGLNPTHKDYETWEHGPTFVK